MSERFYRWLLRLYPPRFRAEYGGAMVQLFRDRLRLEPRLRLWADVLCDLAISLPREYGRWSNWADRPPAEVAGYRMPEEAIGRMMWRGHVREIPAFFLFLASGLAISWAGGAPRWAACAVYALLAAPLAMPLARIGRYKNRWRNWELRMDAERIQQCEGGAVRLSLERTEITRVVETPCAGMAVQTADPRRGIWIPALLNGYAELRGRLMAWAPVEEQALDRRKVNALRGFQWLFAFYPAALLVRSPAFAIPLAVLMAGHLAYFSRRLLMGQRIPPAVWLVPITLLALLAAKVGYTLR